MFRKRTHGQVISAELQEGFSHIGNAVTEARRAAAEQVVPRVEAARAAAGPALETAQLAVTPRVAAAVAVAAPAVASARESLAPRFDAAREAASPALEAAQKAVDAGLLAAVEAITPRVGAVRDAAGPRLSSAVTVAQAAAVRAAEDLGPRLEAAQKAAQRALSDDLVPRLGAAQTAALAYAAPRVVAARRAVAPALENARGTLAAGVDTARSELEARRIGLAASTALARNQAGKRRRDLGRRGATTAARLRRRAAPVPEPRRWPWLVALLAIVAGVTVVLRRRSTDDWTPAPTGDGPVPSYREDPVPSSPSDSGKAVSAAQETPGDATPADSDLGWRSDEDQTTGATDSPADPSGGTATAAPGDQPQTATEAIGAEGGDGSAPGTGTTRP